MSASIGLISIIIPAYNEETRVAPTLERMAVFLKALPYQYEFLLVVEKSSDRTVEIAKRYVGIIPNFRIIENEIQRGKGFAVRKGMLQAKGDYVFFTDLDLSTPPEEILNFVSHFQSHPATDVLIGDRKHSRTELLKEQHPIRKKMGEVFNHFVQTFAMTGVRDTQCGFKGFRKDACRSIFQRQTLNGFSFDVEVLLLSELLGLRITSLPIHWTNSKESKVRIIRDSLKMFWDIIRVRAIVERTLKLNPPEPVPVLSVPDLRKAA